MTIYLELTREFNERPERELAGISLAAAHARIVARAGELLPREVRA